MTKSATVYQLKTIQNRSGKMDEPPRRSAPHEAAAADWRMSAKGRTERELNPFCGFKGPNGIRSIAIHESHPLSSPNVLLLRLRRRLGVEAMTLASYG
jgi:hypothetical protein